MLLFKEMQCIWHSNPVLNIQPLRPLSILTTTCISQQIVECTCDNVMIEQTCFLQPYASSVAASSGLDGHIKIWELENGKLVKSIDGGPGEEPIIQGVRKQIVHSLHPSLPPSLPPVDVWTLAFSPDSHNLATGSHNGKINIFSVEEGKKENVLDTRGKFTMSIAYVSRQQSKVFKLNGICVYSYQIWKLD